MYDMFCYVLYIYNVVIINIQGMHVNTFSDKKFIVLHKIPSISALVPKYIRYCIYADTIRPNVFLCTINRIPRERGSGGCLLRLSAMYTVWSIP